MTKQRAISVLQKQIVKLGQEDFNPKIWRMQTNTYLESFFGENSRQCDYIDSYYFFTQNSGLNISVDDRKHSATKFLNDCIDLITDIGLHKPEPKGNFISRLPEGWAVAIVLGLVTFSYWLGTVFCS